MIRTKPRKALDERQALRKRVKQMYDAFNEEKWGTCFALLDPKLRRTGSVQRSNYARQMCAFKEVYGQVNPWHVRISLHLDEKKSKQESRPFAFVYVVWQDESHGFHMFRERWVKHDGRWFTRVAGLVPNRQESDSDGI